MFCWFSSLFCLSQSETGVKAVGVWRCANSNHRPEITWMAEIRMSNKESLENWCLHRWFSQQCFSFSLLHFPLWFVIPFNGTPKLIDSIQSASVSDKEPVSQFFFLWRENKESLFLAWRLEGPTKMDKHVVVNGRKSTRKDHKNSTTSPTYFCDEISTGRVYWYMWQGFRARTWDNCWTLASA